MVAGLLCSQPALAVDQPISGKKLMVGRSASGKEKLVFVSRDPAFLFPIIGGPDDPTLAGGALVELFAENEPGPAAFAVPPDIGKPGWKVKDKAVDQFKFSNADAPGGPSALKTLLLKEGTVLKVVGKQAGLSLAGPLGAVGIRITVGTQRNCARFSGVRVKVDEPGLFGGKNARASALPDCSDASLAGTNPFLYEAGLCTFTEPPNLSVASGTDLFRVTLTDPEAVCNDGTSAVLYVRAADPAGPDAGKWIIWLEGGGGCLDPKSCGDRWCGLDPPYTAGKMSSRWAPEGIKGNGIFDPTPSGGRVNQFAGFNLAVFYYCSSDSWMGTHTIDVQDPSGTYPPYRIAIEGYDIVTAGLTALKAGVTSDNSTVTMPDLDDATQVLFMGTSAGSGGAQHNGDRVGELLLADNPDLDYRLVADAAITPTEPDPPELTAAEAEAQLQLAFDIETQFRGAVFDASCLAYHAADPRPCADHVHVLRHHTSTPFFAKMDLSDSVSTPGLYDTDMSFSFAVFDLLTMLAMRPTWAEEVTAQTVPGVFGPLCGHHVNLESTAFYDIQLDSAPYGPLSLQDTLGNWLAGAAPTFLVHNPPAGITSVCP